MASALLSGENAGSTNDPLVCRQCGGKLKAIAYVSDEIDSHLRS